MMMTEVKTKMIYPSFLLPVRVRPSWNASHGDRKGGKAFGRRKRDRGGRKMMKSQWVQCVPDIRSTVLSKENWPYKQEDLILDQVYQVTLNNWDQLNSRLITGMALYPWTLYPGLTVVDSVTLVRTLATFMSKACAARRRKRNDDRGNSDGLSASRQRWAEAQSRSTNSERLNRKNILLS